jgi:hypothetical protein
VTDQTPGSNPPSGHPKRKSWKVLAQDALEKAWNLEAKVRELETELAESRSLGLTNRDAVVLRSLKHFYARVINAPLSPEGRAVIDNIMADYAHVVGKETT